MNFKEELVKMYNKGYREGFEDCMMNQIEALEIAIAAGYKDTVTLPEVVTMLKATKAPEV